MKKSLLKQCSQDFNRKYESLKHQKIDIEFKCDDKIEATKEIPKVESIKKKIIIRDDEEVTN